MTLGERELLEKLNADNRAALYRCRWSPSDAEAVVPKLIPLLASEESAVVDETLRVLFCIGTPAEDAAESILALLDSESAMTRHLALLALGQVAHQRPAMLVPAIIGLLGDERLCRDVLRILAFLGSASKEALPRVVQLSDHPDAKVRKAVVDAAIKIDPGSAAVKTLVSAALQDRSQVVRRAAARLGGIDES